MMNTFFLCLSLFLKNEPQESVALNTNFQTKKYFGFILYRAHAKGQSLGGGGCRGIFSREIYKKKCKK
jgi:hypothetical protein